jgi:hypothetical protein
MDFLARTNPQASTFAEFCPAFPARMANHAAQAG